MQDIVGKAIAVLIALVGVLALAGILMIISSIVDGWAISTLWGWFAVPLFNVRDISIVQAVSLTFVIAAFRSMKSYKVDKTIGWKEFAMSLVGKVILVGLGWCLKAWFM